MKFTSKDMWFVGMLSTCIVFVSLVATGVLGMHTVCPFKALTGIPCPGCGGIRSIHALLHGEVASALAFNPLTVLLVIAVAVAAVWWTIDRLTGRDTLFTLLARQWSACAAWTAIAVLVANWIWNICKGL